MKTYNLKKINSFLSMALCFVIISIFIMGGVVIHATSFERGINRSINTEQYQIKGHGKAESSLFITDFKQQQSDDLLQIPDVSICNINTSTPNDGGIADCLGEFKITAYTAGVESTGKPPDHPEYGITASGEMVVENLTIAADWDQLPRGTWVYIEDVGYRMVQDKGGAIKENCIDLYISDLGQALEWGVQHKRVWLVKQ